MKIKTVRLSKEYKVGLPQFSNLTTMCDITWEVGENEEFDWDSAWDYVNHQMYVQSSNIDSSWIQNKEYNGFFKTIVRTQKTRPVIQTESGGGEN